MCMTPLCGPSQRNWLSSVSSRLKAPRSSSTSAAGSGPGGKGEGQSMELTDEAIAQIRSLIQSGALPPGSRLPPEPQLAAELGCSRNSMREAVKALETARVLDVRRGDGTYV